MKQNGNKENYFNRITDDLANVIFVIIILLLLKCIYFQVCCVYVLALQGMYG